MSFVLGTESKNFSAYVEIRGATCSFAQSGLEDSGVRSGMCLDNLGVAQDAPLSYNVYSPLRICHLSATPGNKLSPIHRGLIHVHDNGISANRNTQMI